MLFLLLSYLFTFLHFICLTVYFVFFTVTIL
nr:MAG TPA: hypothetical protein [Caudoviricetes sp.]